MNRLPLRINVIHLVILRLCLLFRVFFSHPTNCPTCVPGLAINLLPSSNIVCSRACFTMCHSTRTEGWIFAQVSYTEYASHNCNMMVLAPAHVLSI